jgi:uncharacterized protein (DUF433 family)
LFTVFGREQVDHDLDSLLRGERRVERRIINIGRFEVSINSDRPVFSVHWHDVTRRLKGHNGVEETSAMTIPAELKSVLKSDPEIMHGKLCFTGTRVPLTVLLDNLEEGMGLDEFVEEYPSVSREQAFAVLRWEQQQTRKAIGLEFIY